MELAKTERLLNLPSRKYFPSDHDPAKPPTPASPERRRVAVVARRVLSAQVSREVVDMTGFMDIMTKELLWEISQQTRGVVRELNLSGWKGVSPLELRSLSLLMGESLESLNLSNTNINADCLYMVSIRFFHLRSVDFSNCAEVSDRGIEAIATGAFNTLTSLNISHCPLVTEDSLGWVAGTLGTANRACSALLSLDVSYCDRVRDRGLAHLGRGVPQLRYLNASHLSQIGDEGCTGLARGCAQLRVLNLEYDPLISDEGVLALTYGCPRLKSLTLKYNSLLTDAATRYIAEGLPMLQNLSLAACNEVTEVGLAMLGRGCRDLQVLNVSGCVHVTVRGLRALVAGMPYVQVATSFFGFKPVEDVLAAKLKLQHQVIRDASTLLIQKNWKRFKVQLYLHRQRVAVVREHAATVIQRMVRGVKGQEFFAVVREESRKVKRHIRMQAVVKGWLTRARLTRERLFARAVERVEPRFSVFKAHFRARNTRRIRREAPIAMLRMRAERRREAAVVVAQRTQIVIRAKFAREKVLAEISEWLVRKRIMQAAAVTLQRVFRGFLARYAIAIARAARVKRIRMTYKLARIAQRLWRGFKGRWRARWMRVFCRPLRALTEDRAAIQVQKIVRGNAGRHVAADVRRLYEEKFRTAVKIQKVWRGLKIGTWKQVKLRRLVRVFAKKQNATFEAAKAATKANWFRLRQEMDHDSASDSDETEGDNDWVQFFDDDQHKWQFWSERRQQQVDEVPDWAFEKGLVGRRIAVWWAVQEEWFQGTITKFNVKKQRFKIKYDDGDFEWLNGKEEQDRLQILWDDGVWAFYRLLMERELKARKETWLQEADPTGTPYWTNQYTGEVVWDDPTRKRGPWLNFDPEDSWEDSDTWERHVDEWEGVLYRHKFTGEEVWERPDYKMERERKEAEWMKHKDAQDLGKGRDKRAKLREKKTAEEAKAAADAARKKADEEFKKKMAGTSRYQSLIAEREAEDALKKAAEEARLAELARLAEEEELRRRMEAERLKEERKRERQERKAMKAEETLMRRHLKWVAKQAKAAAKAAARAAADDFVVEEESSEDEVDVLDGDVVSDGDGDDGSALADIKGQVLGRETRRKGKDTFSVAISLEPSDGGGAGGGGGRKEDAKFTLTARNLRSGKVSTQTITYQQMQTSANPFLQEVLQQYLAMAQSKLDAK